MTPEVAKKAAEDLFPYLLPMLAEHFQEREAESHPVKRRGTQIWVPEIDYLVQYVRIREEFRPVEVTTKGRLVKRFSAKNHAYVAYEARGVHTNPATGRNEDYADYIFPGVSLRAWIDSQYYTIFSDDWRIPHAKTYYLGGVLNIDNKPYTSPCSAYRWRNAVPIPQNVIDNTRHYWETMPVHEEAKRILDKPVMFDLLDALEEGHGPWFGVPSYIEWDVVLNTDGVPAPLEMPYSHGFRTNPKKIKPRDTTAIYPISKETNQVCNQMYDAINVTWPDTDNEAVQILRRGNQYV